MRKQLLAAAASALLLTVSNTSYAAEPQVVDGSDDAYQGSLGVPNPLLSDPAYDIVAVEWAMTARNEFTVSMTIKGTPQPGVNYFPFASIGDDHTAYWIFQIGEIAKYNIFENEVDPVTGRQQGVSTTFGSAVEVSGSTISATFSSSRGRLPRTLRDNPVLGPFGGLTCVAPESCGSGRTYDTAESGADSRFSLR